MYDFTYQRYYFGCLHQKIMQQTPTELTELYMADLLGTASNLSNDYQDWHGI